MEKFKIQKNYYNGVIQPYSLILESIEYNIDDSSIKITITREYYSDEKDNFVPKTIKGTFNIDNYFESSNNDEIQEQIEDFKDTLNDWAEEIQDGYTEEYFINSAPHCLNYTIVEIDGEEYRFGNLECKDELYQLPKEIINYDPLIRLPNKLLSKVLSIINTEEQ